MRRWVIASAIVAACGGAPARPAAPAPAPPPPPAHAAPQPAAAAAPIVSRLRDAGGPIAGLPSYSLARANDAGYCGGVQVTVRSARVKVSADDQPFVDVLALEFPTGLDFTADRQGSLEKLQRSLRELVATGRRVHDHYADIVQHGEPPAQLAAMARIAQVHFRLASVIARAPIPKDIATGDYAKDKIEAYCDKMGEVAAPLQEAGEEAAKACADKATVLGARGWWSDVCKP